MRADEYNSFEKQLGRYRAAISRLEHFNIRVAGGSRLRVYERLIERRFLTFDQLSKLTWYSPLHSLFAKLMKSLRSSTIFPLNQTPQHLSC